jgi:hypothetical protein
MLKNGVDALLGPIRGINTPSALEDLPHAVQALRRSSVGFAQPKPASFELGPDDPLGLDQPIKARLSELLDRLLRSRERLTKRQMENGDPFRWSAPLRSSPLFDRVVSLWHGASLFGLNSDIPLDASRSSLTIAYRPVQATIVRPDQSEGGDHGKQPALSLDNVTKLDR